MNRNPATEPTVGDALKRSVTWIVTGTELPRGVWVYQDGGWYDGGERWIHLTAWRAWARKAKVLYTSDQPDVPS